MAYTRKIGSHAKVTIDGTDVSNSFSSLTRNSENEQIPAGGFNTTGVAETLPGQRTQSFTGQAWYTEELATIVDALHESGDSALMTFQPNGLVDATREIYSGNVFITEFSPTEEFGAVATFPFTAVAADSDGISVGNWT